MPSPRMKMPARRPELEEVVGKTAEAIQNISIDSIDPVDSKSSK
jgi:hypothetical protein